MNDNETYVKIVDAYLNTGTIIESSRDDHSKLYWLVAMGMHETLILMGGVKIYDR